MCHFACRGQKNLAFCSLQAKNYNHSARRRQKIVVILLTAGKKDGSFCSPRQAKNCVTELLTAGENFWYFARRRQKIVVILDATGTKSWVILLTTAIRFWSFCLPQVQKLRQCSAHRRRKIEVILLAVGKIFGHFTRHRQKFLVKIFACRRNILAILLTAGENVGHFARCRRKSWLCCSPQEFFLVILLAALQLEQPIITADRPA